MQFRERFKLANRNNIQHARSRKYSAEVKPTDPLDGLKQEQNQLRFLSRCSAFFHFLQYWPIRNIEAANGPRRFFNNRLSVGSTFPSLSLLHPSSLSLFFFFVVAPLFARSLISRRSIRRSPWRKRGDYSRVYFKCIVSVYMYIICVILYYIFIIIIL